MLLDAIITVLRETLEAGVLIGVLLAVGQIRHQRALWLLPALALGGALSWLIAANLGAISAQFDYRGQELLNASLQLLIFVLLLAVIAQRHRSPGFPLLAVTLLASSITTLAVIREGSEVIIFYQGFTHDPALLQRALVSGFIGMAIGASVGALVFYLLVQLQTARTRKLQTLVLVLIGAGMVMQAAQTLLQVDLLPAGLPVWDSNHLLNESTISGQLVYAVFGYEATPTLAELICYGSAILLSLLTLHFTRRSR